MLDYAFILVNAAAINMAAVGVLLLNSRKVGGLRFFRFWRIRVSFCLVRNHNTYTKERSHGIRLEHGRYLAG